MNTPKHSIISILTTTSFQWSKALHTEWYIPQKKTKIKGLVFIYGQPFPSRNVAIRDWSWQGDTNYTIRRRLLRLILSFQSCGHLALPQAVYQPIFLIVYEDKNTLSRKCLAAAFRACNFVLGAGDHVDLDVSTEDDLCHMIAILPYVFKAPRMCMFQFQHSWMLKSYFLSARLRAQCFGVFSKGGPQQGLHRYFSGEVSFRKDNIQTN